MKEWRGHWSRGRFLQVFFLGLSASLFDSGTDLNFAWSAETDCKRFARCDDRDAQRFDLDEISSPCGLFDYKMVERTTFTIIAFPGFLLAFSGLRSLAALLIQKCKNDFPKSVVGLTKAFTSALEVALFLLLALGNNWSERMLCDRPDLATVWDTTVRGMAYISVALTVGVKIFGMLCHGPESRRLVFWAKEKESKFEAAFQLVLVSRIDFSSGITTPAGLLSASSSVFFISINCIETFLRRHETKLEEASLLGKICVALSVLPVFLLATVFKIGASACGRAWHQESVSLNIYIGFGIANLSMLILKMCGQLEDFGSTTDIFQWILSDFLTLNLWPKGPTALGKRSGWS